MIDKCGRVFLVLAAMQALVACSSGSSGSEGSGSVAAPQLALTTEQTLIASVQNSLRQSQHRYAVYPMAFAQEVADQAVAADGLAFSTTTASSSARQYSSTTVQQAGVDEADVMKNAGHWMWFVSQDQQQVLRASTEQPDMVQEAGALDLDLPDGHRISSLMLSDDQQSLAVFSHSGAPVYRTDLMDAWWFDGNYREASTYLQVSRDITGLSEPGVAHSAHAPFGQKVFEVQINARLLGARRIGSTLYWILR